MKKQIYFSILRSTLLAILSSSLLMSYLFYQQLSRTIRTDLKWRAHLLATDLPQDLSETPPDAALQIRILDPSGKVLAKNTDDPASDYSTRKEFVEAIENGTGESRRLSQTLWEETYCYAVRLADGNVLHLSKIIDSPRILLRQTLALLLIEVLLAAGLARYLARRLTKRITEPLYAEDMKGDPPCDELSPILRTVEKQKKQIESQRRELQAQSRILEVIMSGMSEGLVLIDRSGTILSVNQSAAHLIPLNDPIGKHILEAFREVPFRKKINIALQGERAEYEFHLADRDYKVILNPVNEGGALMLFLDITQRNSIDRIRREFSANVSHELKTPLTAIYGNAEMLRNGMIRAGDEAIFYEKIQNEAARMISLIENILLISKLDENEPSEAQWEHIRLDEIAGEVIDSLSAMISEKRIVLAVRADEVEMDANAAQLYELIHNLMENAIKYNKEGGTLTLDIYEKDRQIHIRVSDTGIGIPASEQERIFERFYRVDKSRNKATGGSGLGLAIVKHIVLAYGGTIELESEINIGTRITISFPRDHQRPPSTAYTRNKPTERRKNRIHAAAD